MMKDHLKKLWLRYWSSIRHRQWAPYAILGILVHKFTFSCSPLTEELVRLTRARHSESISSDERKSGLSDELFSLNHDLGETDHTQVRQNDERDDEREEEYWYKHLTRPREVIQYIKRYHCVGNEFFIITATQFGILYYLGLKSLFYRFAVGRNQELAKYYADRYFARICHSFPNSYNLDLFTANVCTYLIILRTIRLYTLTKNAIINRNGYRNATICQSNMCAMSCFCLPVEKWILYWKLMWNHKKECNENRHVKELHLMFEDATEDAVKRKPIVEFTYFRNWFSYDGCLKGLGDEYSKLDNKPSYAKGWYIPMPIDRVHPTEFFWVVVLTAVGVPLIIFLVSSVVVFAIFGELYAIASDNNEDSCLAQVAVMLSSLASYLRIIDIFFYVIMMVPQHADAGMFYYDCCVVIGHANKVNEALQEQLKFCKAEARFHDDAASSNHLMTFIHMSDYGSNRIGRPSLKEKKRLNRSIMFYVRLIRCICQEFRDLRRAHEGFLNILLVGAGLLISISISEILIDNGVTDLRAKRYSMQWYIVSCTVPIMLSLYCCIAIEHSVSRMKMNVNPSISPI